MERLRGHPFHSSQSSTAESSATSSYVVVPERLGQNAEPASRTEERTEKKPRFAPSSRFN